MFAGARRVALMDDLKELGVITFELDVTKQETIDKARRLVVDHNDGKETLDILVNNAGLGKFNSVADMPVEDVQYQFDVNYFGTLRMIKTFLPLLMNSKGKIVITSSVAGVLAIPFLGAYSDTKAALISLSRSLRTELEPFNIQVCCTITGGVDTHSQAADSKFPDGEF